MTVKDKALGFITDYISQNQLKIGDKLPSSAEFCRMMGASLTSVREALKILEAKGVVEVVNGIGIFVRSSTTNNFLITIEKNMEKDQIAQLMEVFEVRKMLEAQIIKNIYEYATSEELARVELSVKRLMKRYKCGESTVNEDRRFHSELYAICHNSLLEQLANSVIETFDKIYTTEDNGFDVTYSDTVVQHEKMFRALSRGDVSTALRINGKTIDRVIFRLDNLR
ncbi:MAG: GntR family transcriptional regulator [Oscillospiraceae bacterium]|nr:GntR family transcriptional regulator [Oscillospiraceae bacterium]